MHLTNDNYFDYWKKPEDTQIEPHAEIKMVQALASLVYIRGLRSCSAIAQIYYQSSKLK